LSQLFVKVRLGALQFRKPGRILSLHGSFDVPKELITLALEALESERAQVTLRLFQIGGNPGPEQRVERQTLFLGTQNPLGFREIQILMALSSFPQMLKYTLPN
jgi:hypothetical protein